MNLIFFDIECASVSKNYAKICAFGYVVCDEQFNILKKEDILINPRGGFHLTDSKGDKGVVLPYDYGEFKKYPPFPKVYGYIKSLLEDENSAVLGHSTLNDVKYLNLETKRFKLPPFKFKFSDSQLIYKSYTNDYARQMGLGAIAAELGVEFVPHRAADDAYATMRIVEAMCKAKGMGYFELTKRLGIKEGRIKNFDIIPPVSDGEMRYVKQKEKSRLESVEKRVRFFNYLSRKKIRRDGALFGKVFSFSNLIEEDLPLAKSLADKIYKCGGSYTRHVTHCDYYVAEISDETPRTLNAKKTDGVTVTDVAGLERVLDESARRI